MSMLSTAYNSLLYVPILNVLVFLYHIFFDNFGVAIIVLTAILRVIMFPLSKPSMEAAKKQQELKPQIDALKKKYKNKQVLAQKQMALFKEHGINPAAGCLPQIVPIIIIFALYRVFINLLSGNGVMISEVNHLLYNWDYLKFADNAVLNTSFFYLNLAKPDPIYLLPLLAAGTQFLMSKYMTKGTGIMKKTTEDTPDKKDDIMYNMQGQMTYIMPVMTLVIGINLPSGLVLYWFISTLFGLGQYVLINRSKKA